MSATTNDAGWDANTGVPEGCDDSSRSAASSLLDDVCRLVTLPCISTTVVTTRPCRFSDRFLTRSSCLAGGRAFNCRVFADTKPASAC
jgi:hypothetical protein